MKPVQIPTRADDPQHFLLWSADEMFPIVIGMVFGMAVQQVLICTLIGMGITNLYRRFRDGHADGYLIHFLYHWGMGFSKAPSMINPFIKRLFP